MKGAARRSASLLLLLGLTACTFSTAAQPVFEKNGVVAMGPMEKGIYTERLRGDERFSIVSGFDNRDLFGRRRDRPIPPFCVQLGPGCPPTRADALTREAAERCLAPWAPGPGEDEAAIRQFYPGQILLAGPGAFLGFEEATGKLLKLSIGHGDPAKLPPLEAAARIGPASCEPLYAPPLSHEQLVEIFGKADWEGWRRDVENMLLLF